MSREGEVFSFHKKKKCHEIFVCVTWTKKWRVTCHTSSLGDLCLWNLNKKVGLVTRHLLYTCLTCHTSSLGHVGRVTRHPLDTCRCDMNLRHGGTCHTSSLVPTVHRDIVCSWFLSVVVVVLSLWTSLVCSTHSRTSARCANAGTLNFYPKSLQ